MNRLRDWLLGGIVGLVLATGVYACWTAAADTVPVDSSRIQGSFSASHLALMRQARTVLETYHVDEKKLPGEDKFYYGAMKGLVGAVDDPYTRFVEPTRLKEENIEMEGQYGGLGIYIGQREGRTLIISPIEGTPADRAKLKPLDEIVKIGDKIVIGTDQDEIVKMLRGAPGTKVTIWVRREGKPQLLRFDLTREIIKLKTVRLEMLPKGVAYIRLAHFNQKTASELGDVLAKAKAKGARGVVLDLRNNPGGLLNSAVDVASYFLDGGLVVGMRGRVEKANDALYAEKGEAIRLPVVVLINEGSASASEIVAGALRDRKRAVLVGMKSFGKGSVQTLFNLPDGSGIYVTIARYYTPSGKLIDHVGLQPDVKVAGEPQIDRKKDKQLRKAVEVLLSRMGR